MKPSLTWLGEAAIAAAIVAAVAALALPGTPRVAPVAPVVTGPRMAFPEPLEEPAIVRASATPARIAELFGWKQPAPPRATAATRPVPSKPVPARLKLIGFVENDTGTISWIFKDLPSGTVVSLTPGATSRGWTLVEVGEREFRLAYQGTTYAIPRGK